MCIWNDVSSLSQGYFWAGLEAEKTQGYSWYGFGTQSGVDMALHFVIQKVKQDWHIWQNQPGIYWALDGVISLCHSCDSRIETSLERLQHLQHSGSAPKWIVISSSQQISQQTLSIISYSNALWFELAVSELWGEI